MHYLLYINWVFFYFLPGHEHIGSSAEIELKKTLTRFKKNKSGNWRDMCNKLFLTIIFFFSFHYCTDSCSKMHLNTTFQLKNYTLWSEKILNCLFFTLIYCLFFDFINFFLGGEREGRGLGGWFKILDKGGVNSNKAYGYFQLFCMANIVLVHAGTRYGVWDLICDFFI